MASAIRLLGSVVIAVVLCMVVMVPAAGAKLGVVGSLGGPGVISSFTRPIAVNPATGTVYMIESFNERVAGFEKDGDNVRDQFFGPTGLLGEPLAIGASFDGSKLYLATTCNCFEIEGHEVAEFDATTEAFLARFGNIEGDPGLIDYPRSVASGPGAVIYVANGNQVGINPPPGIIKYDSSGNFVDLLAEAGSGAGELPFGAVSLDVDRTTGDIYALAFTSEGRKVYRYDSDGVFEAELVGESTAGVKTDQEPDEIGIHPVTGNLFVSANPVGAADSNERQIYELDEGDGSLIETHAKKPTQGFEGYQGIEFDPSGTPMYVGVGNRTYIFDTLAGGPEGTLGAAQEIASTGAKFSGEIDANAVDSYPNPPATSWLLEYKRASDPTWTPYAPAKSIGTENDVTFTAIIGGLDPNTAYDVRLTVTREDGEVDVDSQSFETGEAAPEIKSFTSANHTATTADLQATINPFGLETSYRFEYGTSTDYSHVVPVPDGSVGDGHEAITVTNLITDLEPVTYHFRVVATNAAGTTTTEDQTFEFFPPTCPNQTIRQQTRSNYLPDCRGYELVSPGDAGGVTLLPGGPNTGYADSPSRMSFVGVFGSLPGQDQNINTLADLYVATRTGTGWESRYVGLPSTETGCMGNPPMGTVGAGSTAYAEGSDKLHRWIFTDPEMSKFALWSNGPVFSCAQAGGLPDASEAPQSNAPWIFAADGTQLDRFPTNLAATPEGEQALTCEGIGGNSPHCDSEVAASGDLTHFVFSTRGSAQFDPLEPGVTTAPGTVYDNDVVSGSVTIASKTPGGANIPQEPGNADANDLLLIPKVSGDGSRILMAASSGPRCYADAVPFPQPRETESWCPSPYKVPVHLYLREDGSFSYDVSEGHQVIYLGATDDLSKVFFTSPEKLTTEDQDTSVDLYMWTAVDKELTLLSIGNNGAGNTDDCPTATWTTKCSVVPISFKNFSMLPGGRGGNERNDSFIASGSGDIYFYAPELLDGAKGVFGKQQLYVYRDGDIHHVVSFTPTIPGTDLVSQLGGEHCVNPPQGSDGVGDDFCSEGPVVRMNVSPDGENMAFVTSDRITSYDNSNPDYSAPPDLKKFAMMYTFDPASGLIRCASCPADDSPPVSDTLGSQNGLFMSNDGRVAFFTENALVPRDTNKGGDTYEFVENRAQLISSGTGVTSVSPDAFTGGAAFVFGQPGFYGMSANGTDIYFSTFDTLVPGDRNGGMLKFYDARSGGGFASEAPRQPCVAADECHGPESAPAPRPRFGTTADLGDRGNAPFNRCARTNTKARRAKTRAAKRRWRKAAKRCRTAERKRGGAR